MDADSDLYGQRLRASSARRAFVTAIPVFLVVAALFAWRGYRVWNRTAAASRAEPERVNLMVGDGDTVSYGGTRYSTTDAKALEARIALDHPTSHVIVCTPSGSRSEWTVKLTTDAMFGHANTMHVSEAHPPYCGR